MPNFYVFQVLYASIVDTLTLCLGTLLTNDLAFAWKAFIQEGLRVFLQGLEKDVPKRMTNTCRVDMCGIL